MTFVQKLVRLVDRELAVHSHSRVVVAQLLGVAVSCALRNGVTAEEIKDALDEHVSRGRGAME